MALAIETMKKQEEMQEEQMNAMVAQQGMTPGVNPAPGNIAAALWVVKVWEPPPLMLALCK